MVYNDFDDNFSGYLVCLGGLFLYKTNVILMSIYPIDINITFVITKNIRDLQEIIEPMNSIVFGPNGATFIKKV